MKVQHATPTGHGIPRRRFLQAGASLVTALALPKILFAKTGNPINFDTKYKMVPVSNVQRPIIMVWLEGGMSHIDSFSPLPGAPENIRGPYGTIQTSLPGVRISSMLPLTAKHLNKMALMRNIQVTDPTNNHPTSTSYMFTGSSMTVGRDVHERAVHESFASRFAEHFGQNNLGYVGFSTWPGFGTFYPGMAHQDSLFVMQQQLQHDNKGNHPYANPFNGEVDKETRMRREALLAKMASSRINSEQTRIWDKQRTQANVILNGDFSEAFDLTKVPDQARELYGKTSFGNAALIGKRMIRKGAPFVLVNNPGWDQHDRFKDTSTSSLNPGLDYKLPEFDKVVSALFTELGNEAVIAVGTEFGRTPKINDKDGRDHWGNQDF